MFSKRQDLLLAAATGLILMTIIIYSYNNVIIPKVRIETEKNIRMELDDRAMQKVKVAVITEGKDIPKYTVLSDEIINSKIKFVEIPIKYTAKGTVGDLDFIRGKVTKEDFSSGEQILMDNLSIEKKWFGEYERLKEYNVGSIVAGEAKTGNIVDIVVSYGNGEYDVVVPKVKIKKLVEDTVKGEGKGSDKSSVSKPVEVKGSYTLVIAVDEEQYRDLELAEMVGKLKTRLYIDESQPASKKSFDYAGIYKKFNISSDKTVRAIRFGN
ncbi:MAG: hypothetical protein K0R31_214 [Clostridiales bacterium]|jgi:hypothetical protein|nr:hypothetical protein [Clostridiales bacterium]